MAIFSTGFFVWAWRVIGIVAAVMIFASLIESAAKSWERAKGRSGFMKLWVIADEIVIGLVVVALIAGIFFLNDLGSVITLIWTFIQLIWNTIIAPVWNLIFPAQ